MSYSVRELFRTVQGEGTKAGTPAIFVRFAGCNFWSGREEDRASSACPFCDTEFRGIDGENGGRYSAEEVAELARGLGPKTPLVVLTGGEPLLQVDRELVDALRGSNFVVAVETNGSVALPEDKLGIDWVVCSPKDSSRLELAEANELKIIFPAQDPLLYEKVVKARHRFVQPEDGPGEKMLESIAACLSFVHENPGWRVSVQTHKFMGVK